MTDDQGFESIGELWDRHKAKQDRERFLVRHGELWDRHKARQDRERFLVRHPGEPEHPNDRLARLVRLLEIDVDPEGHMMIKRGDVEWLIDQVIAHRSELERIAEAEPSHRRRIQARLEKAT